MRNLFGSDVNNEVGVRNVYGGAGGSTTGTRGSAFTPYTAGAPGSEVPVNGGGNGRIIGNGVMGKPLSWWFLLAILLFALMWTAQRFGTVGEDFKNVRMSVYNIIVITLAAMVGFGAFKVIFGRIRVPGLSDYIAAV